jgi:hypothetical protein
MDAAALIDILARNAKADLQLFIDSDPELRLFEVGMMKFGSSAGQIGKGRLSSWIWQHREKHGTNKTVEELMRFLASPTIDGIDVVAVHGLSVGESIPLAKDIVIAPLDSLPERLLRFDDVIASPTGHRITSAPDSIVFCPNPSAPKIITSEPPLKGSRTYSSRTNELVDICRCLSTIGPSAPVVGAQWWETRDPLARWMRNGYGYGNELHDISTRHHSKLTPENYAKAQNVVRRYLELPQSERTRLRVPLDRLNRAIRRLEDVDRAIELGVACESIFLGDQSSDRGELSFRLRLRVAWLLGKDASERQRLMRLFRDLYAIRSSAVHSGNLPSTIDNPGTILDEGIKAVAEALYVVIVKGAPNWDKLVLAAD